MPGGTITIPTSSFMELVDITPRVIDLLREHPLDSGMLYLFNPHTTAGLTINEGADPDVQADIIKGLRHMVPEKLDFRHMEGNSPSHIMALLTGSSLTLQVEQDRPVLGTWQRIFFCEYDGPRSRSVNWKTISLS